jgi:CspA family cold shock protein
MTLTEGAHAMATGTVKWWKDERGYGYIVADSDRADVFVHQSGVLGSVELYEGLRVTFEIKEGFDGRTSAINVHEGVEACNAA